jgi:DNA-binding NarL/FixJ family response regulator
MKILIADDHPIFRKGLLDILQTGIPECEFIECEQGDTALEKILDWQPDVCVLDIEMPGMNGLDVCKEVVSRQQKSKVVILTMFKEEEVFRKAMLSGALGYVLKDHSAREIIDCIHEVAKGNRYIGPALQSLLSTLDEADKKKEKIREMIQSLTQAEIKTLKMVCKQHTSREIAEMLFVSVKTVENYRSRICKKLELDPRNNSLLLWTMENREILDSIREF